MINIIIEPPDHFLASVQSCKGQLHCKAVFSLACERRCINGCRLSLLTDATDVSLGFEDVIFGGDKRQSETRLRLQAMFYWDQPFLVGWVGCVFSCSIGDKFG